MLPRRTPDPRDLERAALRALAKILARLVRGRKGALVIAFGIAISLALAPQANAKPTADDTLRHHLEATNFARLNADQRKEVARAARKTRDPRLANLAVEALRRVGDRESLQLLDAIAGGKTRVPSVDAEAISVRARLASAEVRMRVAERMIQERLRAG
jgi:hypothetical protein